MRFLRGSYDCGISSRAVKRIREGRGKEINVVGIEYRSEACREKKRSRSFEPQSEGLGAAIRKVDYPI